MLSVVFFSHTSPSSCYFSLSLFLLNFMFLCFFHHYFPFSILAVYLLSLYSFFISLSYPDLSHCNTDDGTRTLDPHWWRVNKPSLGVPEALLDYRPKEGWLKGILIKRKSRGKTAWWQTERLNLYLLLFPLMVLLHSLTLTLKCLVSPLSHPKFVSLMLSHPHESLVYVSIPQVRIIFRLPTS